MQRRLQKLTAGFKIMTEENKILRKELMDTKAILGKLQTKTANPLPVSKPTHEQVKESTKNDMDIDWSAGKI